MRIGIITIQRCDNFGADLQAYALGAKLRSMGYDAENIDYLFYKHFRHQGGKMEKPVLPISFKNHVKELLFPVVSVLRGFRNRKRLTERHRRFDVWFEKNVKVGQEYRSVERLYDDPPQYDVYMVGSDQVWNPRLYSNIKPYFLDFVPKGARCVSYASSFGVGELSGLVFYRYKQWLKKFSYIGLREKSGERIVRAMALNAGVAHVLDPTLLLTAEEWMKVVVRPSEMPMGKYLLLYDLIASSETVELAKRWASKSNLTVVRIGDGTYGPGEFLWLFAHAEAVVTNSFHGTVFSIVNRKPFYFVTPRGMTNAGRIESLLSSLGLNDRNVDACAAGKTICEEVEIGWNDVFLRLDALKAQSLDFILRCLGNEDGSPTRNVPKKCFAVWNANGTTRAASTSGGIFSALAEDMINNQGGIVCGAAWDADFKHVRHRTVESVAELSALRQSKYVYSCASDAIEEAKAALAVGRHVLFCGAPCQCAAMRTAARGIDAKLVLVDFVCHGTPRPDVWASYAEELEKKHDSKLIRYEFRNKDRGWNFQNIVYEFANGIRRRILPWLDPYFHGFSINAFLRSCCYTCPYARLERVGDFTIGDCWRVAASNPEYDDNRGTSLVLVNTDKAAEIWERVLKAGRVNGGDYDIDLAQCRNMALMHPPAKPRCYDGFMACFEETHSFREAAKLYMNWKKTGRYALMYYVKRFGWFYFKHHQ